MLYSAELPLVITTSIKPGTTEATLCSKQDDASQLRHQVIYIVKSKRRHRDFGLAYYYRLSTNQVDLFSTGLVPPLTWEAFESEFSGLTMNRSS
jgi:hypothetical protein